MIALWFYIPATIDLKEGRISYMLPAAKICNNRLVYYGMHWFRYNGFYHYGLYRAM